METINILQHNNTGEVLYTYTGEGGIRAAVEAAVKQGVSLMGAQLKFTDLNGAKLMGANLKGANLSFSNLVGADLSRANLDLSNLCNTNLSGANLTGAILWGSDLCEADLSGATLPDGLRESLAVEDLDQKILAIIESKKGTLEMDAWHSTSCGTTHCRAGWAVVLAGNAGLEAEQKYESSAAGALIYEASYPGELIPNFFEFNNELVLTDIRQRANRTTNQ